MKMRACDVEIDECPPQQVAESGPVEMMMRDLVGKAGARVCVEGVPCRCE